jgi:hypothetical protein
VLAKLNVSKLSSKKPWNFYLVVVAVHSKLVQQGEERFISGDGSWGIIEQEGERNALDFGAITLYRLIESYPRKVVLMCVPSSDRCQRILDKRLSGY